MKTYSGVFALTALSATSIALLSTSEALAQGPGYCDGYARDYARRNSIAEKLADFAKADTNNDGTLDVEEVSKYDKVAQ